MVTLIPLLPFLAFWLIVFRGRRLPGEGAYVAVGALALSGLLSLVILGQVMFGGRYQASMVWAALGDRTLTVGYAVDPLSAVMLFVVTVVGSLHFETVFAAVRAGSLAGPVLTLAAVLVFGGAVGKSAQVPLHVWLPDAMEGPTPVSALIPAATMVAAGVYLVARTYPLFSGSPAHV